MRSGAKVCKSCRSKEPRKGYGQRKNDGTHDAKAVDSSNGKAAFKNLK